MPTRHEHGGGPVIRPGFQNAAKAVAEQGLTKKRAALECGAHYLSRGDKTPLELFLTGVMESTSELSSCVQALTMVFAARSD